jgi:2-dehydropantoate 2-reductase
MTTWHVLGAGAMGTLFSSALLDAGCRVVLLLRDAAEQAALESAGGLALELADATPRTLRPGFSLQAAAGPVRHLLVTTKAHAAVAAVMAVRHRLEPRTQVLLLVNGMGVREALLAQIPSLDVFCGTSTEGAFRTAAGPVRHAGSGVTRIGQAGRVAPPDWFDDWRRSPLTVAWEADIERALWQKLAINCAINPLTALHDCRNGDLAREPLAAQVRQLCGEIRAVLQAVGYADLAATLDASVATVIRDTADNCSSMLQDRRAGRVTEIDYITGHLVRCARRHGVPVPANSRLMEAVKALGP